MKMVKVNRNWENTIPAEFRKKLGIKEGDFLTAEVINQCVVFEPVIRMENCGGVSAGKADVEEPKKEIDRLREEY